MTTYRLIRMIATPAIKNIIMSVSLIGSPFRCASTITHANAVYFVIILAVQTRIAKWTHNAVVFFIGAAITNISNISHRFSFPA